MTAELRLSLVRYAKFIYTTNGRITKQGACSWRSCVVVYSMIHQLPIIDFSAESCRGQHNLHLTNELHYESMVHNQEDEPTSTEQSWDSS